MLPKSYRSPLPPLLGPQSDLGRPSAARPLARSLRPLALPTFTPAHIRHQRDLHARIDEYGRNRHPYLVAIMRRMSRRLHAKTDDAPAPTWLDYGCGKGSFIAELRPGRLFSVVSGYDPAVDAYRARPIERHDLVTCLDVLDVVEPAFVANVIADIAALTRGVAIFAVQTQPLSAQHWPDIVGGSMHVLASQTERAGQDDAERLLIAAIPHDAPRLGGTDILRA